MLGSPEKSFPSRRKPVFSADHQESPRKKSLVETPGHLLLHGLGEVGVRQVTTENQVVIRKRRVPEKVVLEPDDPFPKLRVDDTVPTLVHEVSTAKIPGQFPEAAGRVAALPGPMQAAPVRIARHQAELVT
jgi:hypothetical protein